MKYNKKYDRWVTEDGLVYRYDFKQNKLVLCCTNQPNGYIQVFVSKPERKYIYLHRLVYETFKGPIPDGMEIDHEDTHKDNNALSNLILCTHKENMNNPNTLRKNKGGKPLRGLTRSEFSRKFKAHYGITNFDDPKLYNKELHWFSRHNHKCRWEINDAV